MKSLSYTFSILLFFSLFACKKETEPGQTIVQIGNFNLLPTSRDIIPYWGNQGIRFVDSLNNEMDFLISESSGQSVKGVFYKYNVYESGDTVQYCYTVSQDNIWLRNQQSGLEFQLLLEPVPLYADLESGKVADVLNIYANDPNDPGKSFQVFNLTVNNRTYPQALDNNTLYPSITFHNWTFATVQKTNFTAPKLDLYFKKDLGIVAFKDYSGTLWRFKEVF